MVLPRGGTGGPLQNRWRGFGPSTTVEAMTSTAGRTDSRALPPEQRRTVTENDALGDPSERPDPLRAGGRRRPHRARPRLARRPNELGCGPDTAGPVARGPRLRPAGPRREYGPCPHSSGPR